MTTLYKIMYAFCIFWAVFSGVVAGMCFYNSVPVYGVLLLGCFLYLMLQSEKWLKRGEA